MFGAYADGTIVISVMSFLEMVLFSIIGFGNEISLHDQVLIAISLPFESFERSFKLQLDPFGLTEKRISLLIISDFIVASVASNLMLNYSLQN